MVGSCSIFVLLPSLSSAHLISVFSFSNLVIHRDVEASQIGIIPLLLVDFSFTEQHSETGSCSVVQAGLEFAIFLSPAYWNLFMCAPYSLL